ncbi:MAG: NAD+ synthase [Planctomycetota bacterium]
MRIALCQIDTTIGDFAGNAAKIAAFAARAAAQRAELAVFPELAICGYPPEDLLIRAAFLDAHDAALQALAAAVPADLPVLVGCVARNEAAATTGGRPLHNAAALLRGGRARIVARKCLLPTYDVFDEGRYFDPWPHARQNVVDVSSHRIGVAICEDGWNDDRFFAQRRYPRDPVQELVQEGAELVVNLSASPWTLGKDAFRARMVAHAAKRHGVPMVYVNLVGGNVELQFDGGSLAAGPDGVAFAPVLFEEALHVVDTSARWTGAIAARPEPEMHGRALVQGIRDHAAKFAMPRAVIGLSGGIDSAVVATLATDALGAANVAGLAMPSRYSSDHSVADARALAQNLGIEFHEVSIAPLQQAYDAALAPVFAGVDPGLAGENLQSRMRGALLMAFSNARGHVVLSTGNKSECAVGYCTLYGDTIGALAPIADLWKTEVWALARWLNRDGERIPTRSIEKPPSAELRPDQLDTDSLPPYPELDPVLRLLVEDELGVAEVAARTGMAQERVAELYAKVQVAEFKRYQYPPALRTSERCWSGRRMPVSHRYRER